jgi:hypothetical protein
VEIATASASQPSKQRVKDVQEVWEHYNNGWKAYLGIAQDAYASEGPNLARILNICLNSRGVVSRKQRGRFPARIGGKALSDHVGQRCQLAFYYSVVWDNLRTRMPETTQRIVEMGSGWGAMISGLWLSGAPKDAEYWALEYTDTGRETSELLAKTEPRFRLQTRAFDYHNADFSYLALPLETVVYSIYSIEQITYIKDELIDRIMAIPGFTRCIHIEPVGWQVAPNELIARLERLGKKLGLPPVTQAAAAAQRCWRKRKNRNLLETLRRYEKAGKIVIETIDRDLVSNDPLNPGTLVVWRKA